MNEFVAILLLLVVILVIVNRLPGGCSGMCRQGRDKCDCKGDKQ